MSWSSIALGDLIDIRHGFAFKSEFFSTEGQYILLTPGNCYESGGLRLKGPREKYYTGEIPEDYLLSAGDLLVVMTDLVNTAPILGGAFIIPEDKRFLHNQRLGLVQIKDATKIHKKFLYYLLNTNGYRAQVRGSASGATVRHTSPSRIKQCEVYIPASTDEQARIASMLSAYDDLIENNRRRIQLLEEAARLLYKEWFVHLRFPGHEHRKVNDGVPEGWEKKKLGDVLLELESGGRPRGGARDEGVPSIGAENIIGIGQYDYSKEKYVPEEYFRSMKKGIVQNRDVVVYKDGANIGRSSYFGDGFPHEQCAVNEHVFILRASPEVGQNLLYFWVALAETRQRIVNLNANTAQPGVSQRKLKTLEFLVPDHRVASLFNETVEPIVRQIFVLAKQIQSLIKARNLLLPRLMNGELTV